MTYELHDRAGHVLHVSATTLPPVAFLEAERLTVSQQGRSLILEPSSLYQRYLRDWPKWDPRD